MLVDWLVGHSGNSGRVTLGLRVHLLECFIAGGLLGWLSLPLLPVSAVATVLLASIAAQAGWWLAWRGGLLLCAGAGLGVFVCSDLVGVSTPAADILSAALLLSCALTALGAEVTWSSWPTHESDAEPQGSRMFLLERYQEVVDERDSMAREIMGLNAMIDMMSGKITALEVDLGAANMTCAERQTEITRLWGENTDLAERLTTAQIARLEAERILLEESIERIQIEALINGTGTTTVPTVDATQGAKQ